MVLMYNIPLSYTVTGLHMQQNRNDTIFGKIIFICLHFCIFQNSVVTCHLQGYF